MSSKLVQVDGIRVGHDSRGPFVRAWAQKLNQGSWENLRLELDSEEPGLNEMADLFAFKLVGDPQDASTGGVRSARARLGPNWSRAKVRGASGSEAIVDRTGEWKRQVVEESTAVGAEDKGGFQGLRLVYEVIEKKGDVYRRTWSGSTYAGVDKHRALPDLHRSVMEAKKLLEGSGLVEGGR